MSAAVVPCECVQSDRDSSHQSEVEIEEACSGQSQVAKLGVAVGTSPANKTYRVLVVDDSVLPRMAARTMLGNSAGFRLCGEALSGEEALKAVPALKPDLVLMDVHMPGLDGPAATKAIKEKYPDVKVIAWSVSESGDDLLRMMRAGCTGYVLKDAGPTELNHALDAAVRSESPVPRRMLPEVLKRVAETVPLADRPPGQAQLTSREMQVLRGIAKGHTSKRLAHDIGLAVPSIETHLRNIFRKLNATNRGEAVSTALKIGLLSLADL